MVVNITIGIFSNVASLGSDKLTATVTRVHDPHKEYVV